MRKAVKEGMEGTIVFNQASVDELESEGYKYFQIKGLTIDKHYDYVDPHYILLVPIKSLPVEQAKKDIYEPIDSLIFKKWFTEKSEYLEVVIASNRYQ